MNCKEELTVSFTLSLRSQLRLTLINLGTVVAWKNSFPSGPYLRGVGSYEFNPPPRNVEKKIFWQCNAQRNASADALYVCTIVMS